MPNVPDFESLARRIAHFFSPAAQGDALDPAQALRLVWNARGAADIAKLEADLASQMGATASGPYVKNLDRALRSLDR
jgi:hypothetical protein